MIACQTNCLDCIDVLMKNGSNVNAITTDQITVLHFIAEFCGLEVLELIAGEFDLGNIPNFLDLNDRRINEMKNPLHLAISSSNLDIIKYLIENNLFSVNSLQLIEERTIANLRRDANIYYTPLGFAFSIGSRRDLIDYLIKSGSSLELQTNSIIPAAFCVFSTYNSISKYSKYFRQILKRNGFDIAKLAKLKCDNYFSNFCLLVFFPEILRQFLSYGLNVDDLFNFDFQNCSSTYQIDLHSVFFSFTLKEKFLDNLFDSFSIVCRTKNVISFWNYLKSNILNDLIDQNDEIVKINCNDIARIDCLFGEF